MRHRCQLTAHYSSCSKIVTLSGMEHKGYTVGSTNNNEGEPVDEEAQEVTEVSPRPPPRHVQELNDRLGEIPQMEQDESYSTTMWRVTLITRIIFEAHERAEARRAAKPRRNLYCFSKKELKDGDDFLKQLLWRESQKEDC